MRLFTAILGWKVEEVLVFLENVRSEMKNLKKNNVHPQYT